MSQTTEPIHRSPGLGENFERPFIRITFQKGFPRETGVNGCRVEDVVSAAIERLQQYQTGGLACEENASAIRFLNAAKKALEERIERRRQQGVLNTNICHEIARTEDEDHDFSATGA